jgi:hypothetical protein
MGDVVGGWMLLRQASRREGARGAALARTYAEQVLSLAPGLAAAVTAGAGSLAALDAESLTPA